MSEKRSPSTSPRASPSTFYFARKRSSGGSRGSSGEINAGAGSFGYTVPPSYHGGGGEGGEKDADEVTDFVPEAATADEFKSRPVVAVPPAAAHAAMASIREGADETPAAADEPDRSKDVGTLLLERRVPVRVEAKVYFANERTMLAWLHASVWLFGAAVTIVHYADSDPFSQLYSGMLFGLGVAFTFYAMYRHWSRARMIRVKHPGPYEDLIGPAVLGVCLMIAIVVQFVVKVYSMWY